MYEGYDALKAVSNNVRNKSCIADLKFSVSRSYADKLFSITINKGGKYG